MSEPNNRLEGTTYVYDHHNGSAVGKLYGGDGKFYWGGQGLNGQLLIQDAQDRTLFEYNAKKNTFLMRNGKGEVTALIDGETGQIYAKEFKPLTQEILAAAV